jgi:hypothetical protein
MAQGSLEEQATPLFASCNTEWHNALAPVTYWLMNEIVFARYRSPERLSRLFIGW